MRSARWLNVGAPWTAVTQVNGNPRVTAASVSPPSTLPRMAAAGARLRADSGPPDSPGPVGWASALIHRRAEQQRDLRRVRDEHAEDHWPESGCDLERRREKPDPGADDEQHPRDAAAAGHAPSEER